MRHPLNNTYNKMKSRCYSLKSPDYIRYGGRGIYVSARWLGSDGFRNFIEDMGPKPSSNHSIERIDNDGPYSPDNCTWATRKEQANNRRPKSSFGPKTTRGVSGFRGVDVMKNKWRAYIKVGGKQTTLGVYDTPEEAALIRDAAALRLYGKAADINFPEGSAA